MCDFGPDPSEPSTYPVNAPPLSMSPEIRKLRRVVVVSTNALNHPHGRGPGLCSVVPFSATRPAKSGLGTFSFLLLLPQFDCGRVGEVCLHSAGFPRALRSRLGRPHLYSGKYDRARFGLNRRRDKGRIKSVKTHPRGRLPTESGDIAFFRQSAHIGPVPKRALGACRGRLGLAFPTFLRARKPSKLQDHPVTGSTCDGVSFCRCIGAEFKIFATALFGEKSETFERLRATEYRGHEKNPRGRAARVPVPTHSDSRCHTRKGLPPTEYISPSALKSNAAFSPDCR